MAMVSQRWITLTGKIKIVWDPNKYIWNIYLSIDTKSQKMKKKLNDTFQRILAVSKFSSKFPSFCLKFSVLTVKSLKLKFLRKLCPIYYIEETVTYKGTILKLSGGQGGGGSTINYIWQYDMH